MAYHRLSTAFVTLALVTAAGGAQAATHSATRVVEDGTIRGMCSGRAIHCASNDRLTVGNALGDTDGAFYALGLGGTLTLGFDAPSFAAGSTVTLHEVTFDGGARSTHFEAVDIYSVFRGVMSFVDTVYNTTSTVSVKVAQQFEYIRLVDTTLREFASTSSFDGFDVDSVTIAAIPVPASGVLLLAGLGGMGAIRRLRKGVPRR